MRIHGKKAFHELFRLIRIIEAKDDDLASVKRLNLLILKQVLKAEKAILKHKDTQRQLNKELKTGRGSREASNVIRSKLRRVAHYIDAQEDQIFIWKCFGDALAYIYLDKFSIKHAYFETDRWGVKDKVGMLSGKDGLASELTFLNDAINRGVPAVLCDITNILRYGDLCLLGFSDPFLVEVKSSPKFNKRGRRQLAKLAKLQEFLEKDEAVDFRGGTGVTKRVNLSVAERNYEAELNDCIRRAERDGQCVASPETGITYIAVYGRSDFKEIATALEGQAPAIYMLNSDKNDHSWAPYTPFIRSIRSAKHLIDFIEGRLSLIVAIDTEVLCNLMAKDNWAVRFRPDGEYAIQCLHRPTRAYFGLSRQFVGRAAYEFASLSWMAEASWDNIKQMEEMVASVEPTPDAKAHERRLLEILGPDDEWTRDIVL